MVDVQPERRDVADSLARRMNAGCVGARVGRLHRLVVREFEHHLRPWGLSLPQLEILSTLTVCAGPVKPTVVADLLGAERSTMSRNLAILQERGWVRATETSASGRSLTVTISDSGTATLAAAEQAWVQSQDGLIEHLGPEAPAVLDTWLDALTAREQPSAHGVGTRG